MKKVLLVLVILQLLLVVGWYTWSTITPTRTLKRLPAVLAAATLQMRDLGTSTNEDADGRESRSVVLTVGKDQGVLTVYIYKPSVILNRATVLHDGCTNISKSDDKIQLITGFIDYIRNEQYRQTIEYLLQDANISKDIIQVRQMEIIGVLQDNLKHSSIGRIHVLVWDKETADYIKSLPLKNSEKLILRVIGTDVGLKEQLLYASECLPDKIVAITNQDNKLGKGWDDTEYHHVLRDNDIMYALTRHTPVESNCTWLRHSANCDDGMKHIVSHDTFVLRAKKWNTDIFNELKSITPDKPGMENFVIWFFKNKLKYKIMNPCKRLFVHHHHCVPIRGQNRPRVNTDGRSVSIDFSDKLS